MKDSDHSAIGELGVAPNAVQEIPENPYKVYVGVDALFNADGEITPKSIIWETGEVFEIDRVTDVRRRASRKAGGIGIRYTCQIRGAVRFLFLEHKRWFVERSADRVR